MKTIRMLHCGISALCFICINAAGATIKVKSGAVHEGKVNGLIVLKGKPKEAPSEKDPGKTSYSASYVVINGSDITAIDEKGVHQSGGRAAGIMVATQEGIPLDDLDVVCSGIKISPGPFSVGYTKAGGSIIRIGGRSGQTTISRDAVLGEFREKKESEIRPVIEIETAAGLIKVPVAELVELKPEE